MVVRRTDSKDEGHGGAFLAQWRIRDMRVGMLLKVRQDIVEEPGQWFGVLRRLWTERLHQDCDSSKGE